MWAQHRNNVVEVGAPWLPGYQDLGFSMGLRAAVTGVPHWHALVFLVGGVGDLRPFLVAYCVSLLQPGMRATFHNAAGRENSSQFGLHPFCIYTWLVVCCTDHKVRQG